MFLTMNGGPESKFTLSFYAHIVALVIWFPKRAHLLLNFQWFPNIERSKLCKYIFGEMLWENHGLTTEIGLLVATFKTTYLRRRFLICCKKQQNHDTKHQQLTPKNAFLHQGDRRVRIKNNIFWIFISWKPWVIHLQNGLTLVPYSCQDMICQCWPLHLLFQKNVWRKIPEKNKILHFENF